MKKLVILLMILLLNLGSTVALADGDTLSDEVKIVEHIGIAAGLEERANESISRAEFLSWALKLARIEAGKSSRGIC